MEHQLARIDLISDLLALGVRQRLLTELVPLSKKICSLLGGIQDPDHSYFTGQSKSSYSCGGWIKDKTGSLVANELFRLYAKMFSYQEIIGHPILPGKLVQLSLAFNLKYGHINTVDINKIYSLFVAINCRSVYPSKCKCGTQYIRVDHPSNFECPWCRVGVNHPKALIVKNSHKVFAQLHSYAKECAPRHVC